MNIHEKLASDYYRNTKPFVPYRRPGSTIESIAEAQESEKIRAEYKAEEARLSQLFKQEALEAVGLTGHPKADKAYFMAWDHGHASGFSEVFSYLSELADLLKD